MLQPFINYISKEKLFLPEERILLAVSGGMDSIAMTELFNQARFTYDIAHCNFQLRGKESDLDQFFVSDLAKKQKVSFYFKTFFTKEYSQEKGISIQMAARELRYRWFEELLASGKFDHIATAHHLDDQVETFFINMMRSTGIAGFHGIQPKKGKIIRPMLFATREEISLFVKANHFSFREDSSNKETKYLRNKIRHKIVPVLLEINPEFTKILSENISRVREAEIIFREQIETLRNQIVIKDKDQILLSIKDLKKLNPLSTYLFEFLAPFGFNFSVVSDLARAIDVDPGRQFFSPTYRVIKDRNELIVTTVDPGMTMRINQDEYLIPYDFSLLDDPIKLTLRIIPKTQFFEVDPSVFTANLDLHKVTYPLKLRKWRRGDHFYPFGRNHKKKAERFFYRSETLYCRQRKLLVIM